MDSITAGRGFLKSDRWDEWRQFEKDQKNRVPWPPLEKPFPPDAPLIALVPPDEFKVGAMPLVEAIRQRKSHRKFTDTPLTLEELSFLLWSTQGVHQVIREGAATHRTVPSGGARHSFETHLLVNRVQGLVPGLYRYLALEHKLYRVRSEPDLERKVNQATNNQNFGGAVVFMWTTIPYRSEWRYSFLSHKLIAMDAGHVCQNLYLAATAIGAGTCAIDSYDQDKLDEVLGLDGEDEFTIYVAPVGKL